jgi:O-glycosyl hydrolase
VQHRKGLLATAAVVALALPPLLGVPAAHASGTAAISVDPSVQYQTIQGWGTSLAWWAEAAGGWSRANLTTLDNALFTLSPGGQGLGLNVVRYDIGATTPGDLCAGTMRVGAAVPSFDNVSDTASTGGLPATSYDWTRDPTQVQVLQDAQHDGANVFAAAAYSAPASMTKNNCSGGSTDGSDNLSSANYQDYADYIATVVKHFHDSLGIPFSTVDPLNEPVQSGWNNANCVPSPTYPKTKCQQGMAVSAAAQGSIIGDLSSDLGGQSYVHVSAPDELTVGGSLSDYNGYASSVQGDVSQIDTHNYGDWGSSTESGTPAYLLGQLANKPVWMSEWGAGGDVRNNVEVHPSTAAATAAMTLSQEIVKNENEMHPAAWVIWQAADGPFSGETTAQGLANGAGDVNDLWGLAGIDYSATSNQTVTYPLRYWVMGNYSEFVRPGYRMIQNGDPNTFTAWDAGSNKLVIVTTNPAATSATRSFDLSRFGLSGATVAGYQTAAAPSGGTEEHLQPVTPTSFSTSGATLTDTVPAQSVTTYVVSNATYTGAGSSTEVDDGATGTGQDQWAYTGSTWAGCTGSACGDPQDLYAGTTHWDWSANDTATMAFTGGRVRLFGVTDTNEGRATVSVDGAAPTELDFYSASRHGDQLMWESPQLSGGNHTLTVSVSGTHNPQSTGSLIAIDRAEVDPSTVTVDDATTGTGTDQWSYGGMGWVHCPATSACADPQDMYAGTASWDATPGDTATLAFTGASVTLYGMTDNNEGIANVSVDGGPAQPVDFYSPTRVMNAPVFAARGLTAGNHTLAVTVTGQRDADSGGTVPVIDRAVVNGLVPANAASITSADDTVTGTGSAQWQFAGGGWQSCAGSACGDPQDLYAGTTHWDAAAGDTARFGVTATSTLGTTVKLYGVTDANEGKASVSVDGGPATTLDFYSSARRGNQLVWTSPSLAAGAHTVTLTVLGTKDTGSSGTLVALDRATVAVTPFVAALTDGTVRNDFTGAVGMQFTTGPSGLVVTALGREKVSGNTGSHPLAIIRASDQSLVASASVNTATAAVDAQGFQYAALAAPVMLAPNTTYYLQSSEWAGSDQWYDANSMVTLTNGGTVNPVYVTWDAYGNPTYTSYPSNTGHAYGPVSLLAG